MPAGKPVLAISVAGGDVQDQVTLQLLLGRIDFGLSPAEAVTAPRFATDHFVGSFNQTPPKLGSLSLYEGFSKATVDAWARGHVVTRKPPLGNPVMLAIDPQTGQKQAAGDPKARRHARAHSNDISKGRGDRSLVHSRCKTNISTTAANGGTGGGRGFGRLAVRCAALAAAIVLLLPILPLAGGRHDRAGGQPAGDDLHGDCHADR